MGKCYCDYCDVFLTNDSVAVRKQHNDGNRHKYNVCEYYKQYIGQQLQEQIDAIVESFELSVAQGLIIPSYGLPPVQKPAAQDVKPQVGEKQKGANDGEKEPEQVPESNAEGDQSSARAEAGTDKEDNQPDAHVTADVPPLVKNQPDPSTSVEQKQVGNIQVLGT